LWNKQSPILSKLMTSKVWDVMNDLEMVTSKIVSAREIIDAAIDRIEEHQYDKAETMMVAAYEFLEYYLNEFDEKFKLAWQETVKKQTEFQYTATGEKMPVDDCMPPWGHSDMEALKYSDEELDAMCDKAASDEEKELCREYNVREKEYCEPFTTDTGTVTQNGVTHKEYFKAKIEANSAWNDGWTREYYQKIVDKYEGKKEEKTLTYDEAVAAGWSMTDDGIWWPPQKEDKVVKWQLPVEQVHDDYFVSFPDDLLEASNLKEGDTVEWVDKGDGSYLLRKVTKPLGSDEC
jgi:hypothetical protein